MNSGGLKDATNLPGFPTDSYLTFALAVPFMQGALFSVMNAGTDLARDIETGFLNRLALTPAARRARCSAGLLAGAVVARRCVQAVTYLARRPDRRRRTGRRACGGALVIVALSVTITVAFGTIGLFAALRTGSGEAVQSLFPVFFVFLFLSSMALPLQPDPDRLVPRRRHRQPGLLPARGLPLAADRRLGRRRRWRSASGSPATILASAMSRPAPP